MQNKTESKDLKTLLNQYNQEIDLLKEKLLNGESWDNLTETRNNVTELAIAVHKTYKNKSEEISATYPAEAQDRKSAEEESTLP